MHILILHRVPDSLVRYGDAIDHQAHDVTYVGEADRMHSVPELPARRLSRPGTGDTAEEVLAAITGLSRPDVVIALSEYDLIAAARVREALGTPGPREDDVVLARDKVAMKRAVEAAGIRVPQFIPLERAVVDRGCALPWTGPSVIKPVGGASSEGVEAFASAELAMAAAFKGDFAGPLSGYEIEEFVEGPIIHVDGLVVDGRPVATQASRYVGTCLAYANGQPLGSVQIDTDPALVEWTLQCLAAVRIHTGPYHLEAIESTDGLVFLEVGARFGGADVVDTFELTTGLHIPTVQLKLALGDSTDVHPRPLTTTRRYGWFVCPGHTLGTRYCRVRGVESSRGHPLVWRWVERQTDEPIKGAITYADADVPLAGVIGPGESLAMAAFLEHLFDTYAVEPAMTRA